MPDADRTTTTCPYCREEIRTDAVRCKHCGGRVVSKLTPTHGGTCPYCREAIARDATICRHCRSQLPAVPRPTHGGTCPRCREAIDPQATICRHCRSDLDEAGSGCGCGCGGACGGGEPGGKRCCEDADGPANAVARRRASGGRLGYDKECMDTCVNDCFEKGGRTSKECWDICMDKGGCNGVSGGFGRGWDGYGILARTARPGGRTQRPTPVYTICPDGRMRPCPIVIEGDQVVYRCDLACDAGSGGSGGPNQPGYLP